MGTNVSGLRDLVVVGGEQSSQRFYFLGEMGNTVISRVRMGRGQESKIDMNRFKQRSAETDRT